MNRRSFLAASTAAAATAAATGCATNLPLASSTRSAQSWDPAAFSPSLLAEAPDDVRLPFADVIRWLDATGWTRFLRDAAGINLDPASPTLDDELLRAVPGLNLPGFDDFVGDRAIHPGAPARSLLYHLLASPHVRLPPRYATGTSPYPSVQQLDALENYIYARLALDGYPVAPQDAVLAVFAYEYRPAADTPHGSFADLVFSRTGISRIGTHPPVYLPEDRCFTNRPAGGAGSEAGLAVTPARFALFLAERVGAGHISLAKRERRDSRRTFLLPFRKVFQGDPLLKGQTLFFAESHLNEKLARLAVAEDISLPPDTFDLTRPPFIRRSSTSTLPTSVFQPEHHTSDLVALAAQGSSVLLAPLPGDLVRDAVQTTGGKEERVRFRVPPYNDAFYSSDVSNRRYTTLKIEAYPHRNALDFALSDGLFRGGAQTTGIRSPRNGPMFVNIRHEVSQEGDALRHLGAADHDKIQEGGYWAAAFEDGICDGCVQAFIVPNGSPSPPEAALTLQDPILPAFSLVSAPDFFPLVDGEDLHAFDNQFLEGGTESLAGGRIRPNPNVPLPGTRIPAFPDPRVNPECNAGWVTVRRAEAYTATAVLTRKPPVGSRRDRQGPASPRPNALPDTASNVFAPGWDATYSGEPCGDLAVHLSTLGLGSPFPEDIKLCAAANGMWPGLTPDAARTYQGNLDPIKTGLFSESRPPTAVPLLDSELGVHPDAPAHRHHGLSASPGWDGEYGPFLLRSLSDTRTSSIYVNFADVNAADYVINAKSGLLTAAHLRDLTPQELIQRMAALRRCIRALPGGDRPDRTRLWLVSAEHVTDWSLGARGLSLSDPILGTSTSWATTSQLPDSAGSGFFYVFANVVGDPRPDQPGRLVQRCASLYFCQIGEGHLAWTSLHSPDYRRRPDSAWTLVDS